MSFKRVYTVGSVGIVILHLVACSSQSAGERDSSGQEERVDSSAVKSQTDPGQPAKCRTESGNIDVTAIKWLNKLKKPPVFAPSKEFQFAIAQLSIAN